MSVRPTSYWSRHPQPGKQKGNEGVQAELVSYDVIELDAAYCESLMLRWNKRAGYTARTKENFVGAESCLALIMDV